MVQDPLVGIAFTSNKKPAKMNKGAVCKVHVRGRHKVNVLAVGGGASVPRSPRWFISASLGSFVLAITTSCALVVPAIGWAKNCATWEFQQISPTQTQTHISLQ